MEQWANMTINMTINITEYSEHGLKIWYTLVHNITQYDDIYSNVFFMRYITVIYLYHPAGKKTLVRWFTN